MNKGHAIIAMGIAAFVQACEGPASRPDGNARSAVQSADAHIGIVGASGGDVESCDELPSFISNFASPAVWNARKERILSEYRTLPDCNTRFRERGRAQTAIMAEKVRGAIPGATVSSYAGFRYVFGEGTPAGQTLLDAIQQAQQDGVTHLFVTDQDNIMYSKRMEQRGFDQISTYLRDHPEWEVEVIGFNGYSEQPGFPALLARNVAESVLAAFPDVPASDISVVLPCQGIPQVEEATDPHADRARALAEKVQAAMPEVAIHFTFQNWSEKPGDLQTHAQPSEQVVLPRVANDPRQHVLITPNLQWPVTDISVLWREPVMYREKILAVSPEKQLANEVAWDDSPALADFAAAIIEDILVHDGVGRYDVTLIH